MADDAEWAPPRWLLAQEASRQSRVLVRMSSRRLPVDVVRRSEEGCGWEAMMTDRQGMGRAGLVNEERFSFLFSQSQWSLYNADE